MQLLYGHGNRLSKVLDNAIDVRLLVPILKPSVGEAFIDELCIIIFKPLENVKKLSFRGSIKRSIFKPFIAPVLTNLRSGLKFIQIP
jgi:hypothetical protein